MRTPAWNVARVFERRGDGPRWRVIAGAWVVCGAVFGAGAAGQCQLAKVSPFPLMIPGDAGVAVAYSQDGQTLALGDRTYNSFHGAVWVFVRSGPGWVAQGAVLEPPAADGEAQFGSSVALSDDGNTLLVGGPHVGNGDGLAYVYVRTAGVWVRQGPALTDSTPTLTSFGASVSLSGNGNTAIIGAPSDDGNEGAAHIFRRSAGVWARLTPKLEGTGAIGVGLFGQAVSMSGNGIIAVVGAPRDNNFDGAAYVFVDTGASWVQQGSKLTAPTAPGAGGRFGLCVSTDQLGVRAAIGQPDFNRGTAYVYVRSFGVWSLESELTAVHGNTTYDEYGYAVGINRGGDRAVIGSPTESQTSGAAYGFARSGVIWAPLGGGRIDPVGVAGQASFGFAVSMGANSRGVVIGAPTDYLHGAAFVYSLDSALTWTQQPVGAIVPAGSGAMFTAAASGGAGLTYRWLRNGSAMADGPMTSGTLAAGTGTGTLTLTSITLGENGSAYSCQASNECSVSVSNPAALVVNATCPADFNRSGAVSPQDIFDFLAAFFAACP